MCYVDNQQLISTKPQRLERILHDLATLFPVTEEKPEDWLGAATEYRICPENHLESRLHINLAAYIENVIKHYETYGILSMKKPALPLHPAFRVTQYIDDHEAQEPRPNVPYQRIVGELNWISQHALPCLSFPHNVLAHYLAKWTTRHWHAALRVLRWAYDNRHRAWTLRGSNMHDSTLVAFADSSKNDELDTGYTTLSFQIYLNDNLIVNRTKRKKRIIDATQGHEIRAVYEAYRSLMRVHRMCRRIGYEFRDPPLILSDNEACLSALSHGSLKEESRYVKPKYFIVRQARANNEIRLGYVPTDRMHADLGTKAAHTTERFWYHASAMLDAAPTNDVSKWY